MVPLPDSGGGRQPASYPPPPFGGCATDSPYTARCNRRFASSNPPQREEVKEHVAPQVASGPCRLVAGVPGRAGRPPRRRFERGPSPHAGTALSRSTRVDRRGVLSARSPV